MPEAALIPEAVTPRQDQPLILLVSPHPNDAYLLRNALEGYILEHAAGVEDAVDKTRALFPRAILLEEDAGELDAEQLPYALPILRCSLSHLRGGEAASLPHLVKPVSRQAILATISALKPAVHDLLIVDDDPAMAHFVQQCIQADGNDGLKDCRLFSAASGAEGMTLLQRHPVDAILLDLELPDIHGWEWLNQVRCEPGLASIPVIIISAREPQPGNFVPGSSALELSLNRPLSTSELGKVVRSVLENVLPQFPREKQPA